MLFLQFVLILIPLMLPNLGFAILSWSFIYNRSRLQYSQQLVVVWVVAILLCGVGGFNISYVARSLTQMARSVAHFQTIFITPFQIKV